MSKAIDDLEWSKSLREKTKTYIEKNPEYKPLMEKLLSIAGDFVVIWMPEPELDMLLSRGKLFDAPILFKRMQFCHCHENVGELWFRGKNMKIVTGWALSKDGLWRQHSWVRDMNDTIIETTMVREKYFGVILTHGESEGFYVRECIKKP